MDLELQPAPGQVPSQPPFSLTLLFNPRGFAPPHLTSAFNVQGSMHNKLYQIAHIAEFILHQFLHPSF